MNQPKNATKSKGTTAGKFEVVGFLQMSFSFYVFVGIPIVVLYHIYLDPSSTPKNMVKVVRLCGNTHFCMNILWVLGGSIVIVYIYTIISSDYI